MLITLTHLRILYGTINIFNEIPRLAREMANKYCEGRWIAVGGGGYDIWRVVPRAWAHLWIAMNGNDALQVHCLTEWIKRWQSESPVPLVETWEDPNPLYKPIPRKEEITEKNAQMLKQALHLVREKRESC